MAYGRFTPTLIVAALAAGALSAQEIAPALAERSVVAVSRLMNLRRDLGLTEQHSFKIRNSHQDHLGQLHVRVRQHFNGLPLWGGEGILHQSVEGFDMPMTAAFHRNVLVNTTPALRSQDVLALAHADLAPLGTYVQTPSTELVIYPMTMEVSKPGRRHLDETDLNAADMTVQVQKYVLAYHIHTEVESPEQTAHTDYLIDANTGAILKKWDTLRTSAAVGTGKSQWYGTVNLNTNYTGTTYELRDTTRGTGGTYGNNVTTDMNHGTTGNGTIYTDADNAWGDGNPYGSGTTNSTTGPTGQTAAVDAHRGLQATWDMFKNVFGRNGIDNTGKASYSRMHYSKDYDNAFWSDSCFCMTYGDGAPPTGSYGEADLDTAGHEMTHGVCATTANLTYSGESGGLNEANSDIFGTCVEFYVLGGGGTGTSVPDAAGTGTVTANYTMFENSWGHPGQALRYMYKPSKDGKSPDAWSSTLKNLDVHYSSGPMNRCWYFLARGASATAGDYYTSYLPNGMAGIGNDKAGKIWYRALTVYMTSSTNYAGARAACISAVKDLYGAGGAEEQAVWNAFAGINVGSAWTGGGGDTTAPTVSATESGTSGTITFNATASDNVGVTKVEFYVDGVLKGTDTTSPYSLAFDSNTLSNGSHSLVAKAYDAANNVASSTAVTFTVNNIIIEGNLIQNGGFESGTTNWTATSGAIGTFTGQPAYEGTKNMWLGGNGKTTTEYGYQTVAIPSGITTATLSFYLHIDTAETGSTVYDKLTVTVQNTSGTVLKTLATYSNVNAAAGYTLRTFDVSAYKGQTVRIYFKGTEDSSLQTSFVIDKVSLATK